KPIGAPTSGTNSASRAPAKPAPSPIRAPVAAEPAEVGAGGPPAPRWRPMTARVCPNCQAKMEPDTILCTACGFHTEKGIVIPMAAAAAKAKSATGSDEATRKSSATATGNRADSGAGRVIAGLIKPVIILALVGGLGYAVYSIIEFVRF